MDPPPLTTATLDAPWAPKKANLGALLTTAHERSQIIDTLWAAPSNVSTDTLHRLLKQGGFDSATAQQLLEEAGRLQGPVSDSPPAVAPRRLF